MNTLRHPVQSLLANALRSRLFLMVIAFTNYFIVRALEARALCHWEFYGSLTVGAVVVAVGLFAVPLVPALLGLIRQPGVRRWRDALGALGAGILNLLAYFGIIAGVAVLDNVAGKFGSKTYHRTASPLVNRVLDGWSLGACVLVPSGECSVLARHTWVPLRGKIAKRACMSGVDDTYGTCRVALDEGELDERAFCQQDAMRPYVESVCPRHVRSQVRRQLGVIVHGESRR